MKAVILAAGEGTRLEPLTNVRPKPMIPVANRPLLEHVVEAVAGAGIEEVVLVVGYKRERIQNHFGDGDDWGVEITYAVQDTQLGTGDAALQAESYIGGDFLLLNGDTIVEGSMVERLLEERERTGDAVMAVTRVNEPSNYGVVELEGDRVISIREKPPVHAVSSDLVNAGAYAFGPEIFSAIRNTETGGELAITDTLAATLDEHPIRAAPYQGTWLDVNRPWDLLTVNGAVLDRDGGGVAADARVDPSATVSEIALIGAGTAVQPGAVALRGTALGENVTIGPNAVVENAIVLSDVTVGAGAVVRDCVLGANASVGPNTTAEGGETDVALGDTVHRDVRFGGILGDNARVGGTVTVEPGAVLGDGATVESGATVSGRVPPDAFVVR